MLRRCKGCIDAKGIQSLECQFLSKIICTGKLLGTPEIKRAPTKLIGTRLCNRVDDTAGAAAKLGRISGCNYLKLTDRFLRKCEGRVGPFAAADAAEERLIIIYAIDVYVGVNTTLARQ